MKIALLGYGTVGKSVDRILSEKDVGISVKKILRRPGKATGERMTESFQEILDDPEIDAVAECLSGRDPALEMIRAALKTRKHVVTSNKAALAADFSGLLQTAHENGAQLLFEAAAGGGIPVVEAIKKSSRLDSITRISGILNGTTNFILDKMARYEEPFKKALAEAQALGYAEADPSADLSGADIRNKAVIVASLAFGSEIRSDFPVIGIEKITDRLLSELLFQGKSLKLMMLAVKRGQRYAAGVVPVVVPQSSFEAGVLSNFNYVSFTGDLVGELSFYGQGAGGLPTADAVISNLLDLRDGCALTPKLGRDLEYDPELLTGIGYLNGKAVHGRTLESLVSFASKEGIFLAFEPTGTTTL